jgi:hypothetical protein
MHARQCDDDGMHAKALPRINHKLSLPNVLAQLNACVVIKMERRSI